MILNNKTHLLLFFVAPMLFPVWADAARPKVVAAFSLTGDWARAVGGDDIELTVLAGPGGDAHAYEPSPSDARVLAEADLVLAIGLGFEGWLDRLWKTSKAQGKLLRAADHAHLRREGEEVDPHLWGNPDNVARFAVALGDALAEADPGRAAAYRRRAAAYAAALGALDGRIRAAVAGVPAERRVLVTTHDTLGYWAERYGFRVPGTLLSSFSTEAADPSAASLARLSDTVRTEKIPAVFVDTVSNDRLARALARSSGARIAPPLYTDALGPPNSPGGTYIGMMEHNARVIAEALK